MEEIIQKEQKLPGFLKVLCILTYVGGGLGLISNIFTLIALKTTQVFTMAMVQAAAKSGHVVDEGTIIFNSNVNIGASIITSIGCIIGALLMWKLKKNGFYLYLVSQLIAASFPFIFPIMPDVSLMTYISLLFPMTFIVLYALNLKHME